MSYIKIKDLIKQDYFNKIKLLYKNIDEKKLLKIIDKKIDNTFSPEEIVVYNNYKEKKVISDSEKICNYILKKKPIINAVGCMWKQHHEEKNPTLDLLETILSDRKKLKKEMFQAEQDKDNNLRKLKDRGQRIKKILANSFYGISTKLVSYFYNYYVGTSITMQGRDIIFTAMTHFERLLSSNFIFEKLDDFIIYIYNILKECKYKYDINKIKTEEISSEKLFDFLIKKFNYEVSNDEIEIINKIINNLSKKEKKLVYYKNNLYEFFNDNLIIKKYLSKIIKSKEEFKNPNEPIDEFKIILDKIWILFEEFVFYKFPIFDVNKIATNMNRDTVILVDTDSNLLNLEPWYNFLDNLFIDQNIKKNNLSMVYKCTSIIAYLLSKSIAGMFDMLTKKYLIEDESKRKKISMKNEFLFKRVLIVAMRNYASSILLQEGKVKDPPQKELKGLAIKKIIVNSEISSIYQKLLYDKILIADEIDYSEIFNELNNIEEKIKNSFKNKELKYCTPFRVKTYDNYANPFAMEQIRATYLYNLIYPDKEIRLPTEINMLYLNIPTLEELYPLRNINEELFDKIKTGYFENENISKYGISSIAFPKNLKKIPKIFIQFIDYERITKNLLQPFLPILKSMEVKMLKIKSDTQYYSNIINF